jgi:hypothetical protein
MPVCDVAIAVAGWGCLLFVFYVHVQFAFVGLLTLLSVVFVFVLCLVHAPCLGCLWFFLVLLCSVFGFWILDLAVFCVRVHSGMAADADVPRSFLYSDLGCKVIKKYPWHHRDPPGPPAPRPPSEKRFLPDFVFSY